jgi:dethiobiotin synthetase/adenosylmethionine--8-amino-7-oxononanoate aminotransferase
MACRYDADRGDRARIGACIIEPLMQGANGMLLVDPLFQRVLVEACRARGIPIIFDEIFAGLWRLGTASAWERLGVMPDIACYAKLLTGTLLLLCKHDRRCVLCRSFRQSAACLA